LSDSKISGQKVVKKEDLKEILKRPRDHSMEPVTSMEPVKDTSSALERVSSLVPMTEAN